MSEHDGAPIRPKSRERADYRMGLYQGLLFFLPDHLDEAWCVVNGIPDRTQTYWYDGTADHTILASGLDSGIVPVHDVVHYLYLSNHTVPDFPMQVRPSTVAPTAGYLGTRGVPRNWRHVGWYGCSTGVNVIGAHSPQTQAFDALHNQGIQSFTMAQDADLINTLVGNFEEAFRAKFLLPPRSRIILDVLGEGQPNAAASVQLTSRCAAGALAGLATWHEQDGVIDSLAVANTSTPMLGTCEYEYGSDTPAFVLVPWNAATSGGVGSTTYHNGVIRMRVERA